LLIRWILPLSDCSPLGERLDDDGAAPCPHAGATQHWPIGPPPKTTAVSLGSTATTVLAIGRRTANREAEVVLRDHALADHAVAQAEVLDAGPERGDLAGSLVAGDDRGRRSG
jgi:hypothetical protein